MYEEYKQSKKLQSSIALTSAFTAYANGMGGKNSFKDFVKRLGLFDNKFAKTAANNLSREEKIKRARENAEGILKGILKGGE